MAKLLTLKFDARRAAQAIAMMQRGTVIDLDAELARDAARLSIRHRLPMADSIILATARRSDAILWTQDSDFEGLDGVCYLPKG